ncbi:MAG TPA: trypsin-like peptidase domain-containing protein [Vicinamibacterales bacterium]|jgi:hypothetical protein
MRDDEYFAIKTRAAAVFRKIPNVTAIGLGGREREGRPTGEIVIKVFVKRKKPPHEVPPREMIPPQFQGVATDVVEMGTPVRHLDPVPGSVVPPLEDSEMVLTDPLEGGTILGMEPKASGTLGCFLRDKEDGTAIYALTNAHVVDDDERKISLSRRILRASPHGGFDPSPVGYVTAATDKDPFDCAVVRLEAGLKWLPSIKDIGFITGTYDVTIADSVTQLFNVRKRGARTRLTGGILIAVGVETADTLPGAKSLDFVVRPNPPAQPHETDQSCFSFPGDSGSVIVNDDNEVIGLLWGSEDITETPNVKFSMAVANPIGAVLEHFKKVHKLDLDVATPSGPNPHDAQTALPPAGAPLRPLADVLKSRDGGHHRPLSGGSQILGAPFGAASSVTFGCVVTKKGEPGTAYILTSYDGLSANGQIPPNVGTDVGQPDNTDSCSLCCINTVAGFTKGGPDLTTPTAALAQLRDDQSWLAEVMQIGFLEDTASVTVDEINSGTYQVRKRGTGSRLTGGVVTAVGGVGGVLPANVRSDAMLVRPNPNPLKPDTDICFSTLFDRGAILVNAGNKVVGLLYDEVEIVENGVKVVHGVATPIQLVLNALNALPDIEVELATANAPDKKHTTTARTIADHDFALPPLVGDRPLSPNDSGAALDRLRAELSQSIAGRLAIDLWSTHRGEIRDLIDHNRRVAAIWHRSGGPALLQAFTRALHTPSSIIPASVNGLPTSLCLDRLAAAFRRYGSRPLDADVSRLRSALPAIGGRSLVDILAALEMTREPALNH